MTHRKIQWTALVFLALGNAFGYASTIGRNPPAEPLTASRIRQLPAARQRAWLVYLGRSDQQRRADRQFLAEELMRAGITTPIVPLHSSAARSLPLDRAPAWYASDEAHRLADTVLSFQTPAGGWGKNLDMSKGPRKPGEAFVPDNLTRYLSPGDYDTPKDPNWNYVGTIDNDATTTELNFLAKVVNASEAKDRAAYIASFLRGVNYLFNAQFPNGGWPQVWPLEGGYHDAITYNDDAMVEVMELMRRTAERSGEFSFVPAATSRRAAKSFKRGIACIFATQIRVDGRKTVWSQQHDALTLQPVSARNFEPPAQCSTESARILSMLMNDLPHPNHDEEDAIRAAAAWLRKTAIYGKNWVRTAGGWKLIPAADTERTWARYYQVATDLPIFADRDKSIHDNVEDLSEERRNGYRWYSTEPESALAQFEKWNAEHMESK